MPDAAICCVFVDGQPAGTGFAVARGRVLTCAHVVRGGKVSVAFLENSNGIWKLGDQLSVDKTLDKPMEDVASLRLCEGFARSELELGDSIRPPVTGTALGFPQLDQGVAHPMDVTLSIGHVQEREGKPVYVARGDWHQNGTDPAGFSGSPVLVEGRVIGMLTGILPIYPNGERRAANGTLYLTPAHHLRNVDALACGELEAMGVPRYELTVRLTRDGDEVQRQFLTRERMLDHDWIPNLNERLASRDLFGILFGDLPSFRSMAQQLLGNPDHELNPERFRIRLRLETDLDELLAVSWATLCWKAERLVDHGWTVELVPWRQGVQDRAATFFPLSVLLPGPVLFVRPRACEVASRQQKELDEYLHDRFPNVPCDVVSVTTGKDLEAARARPFRALLYVGPAREEDGKLLLELDDGNVPLESWLAVGEARGTSIFQLVLTNQPLGAWMRVLAGSPDRPHIVLVQGTPAGQEAEVDVVSWWRDILFGFQRDKDPIFLWVRAFAEQRIVFGNYAGWTIDVQEEQAIGHEMARYLLDRQTQRDRVLVGASELLESSIHTAAIAMGAGHTDSLVVAFCRQMRYALRRLEHGLKPMHLDLEKYQLTTGLEELLRATLEAHTPQDVPRCVRGRLPDAGRSPHLFILACRVRADTLEAEHVHAWVEGVSQFAANFPGQEARLIALLAIEVKDGLDAIHKAMSRVPEILVEHTYMRALQLPPLEPAEAYHVAEFIETRRPRMPGAERWNVAKSIVQVSQGSFRLVVAWLDWLEMQGFTHASRQQIAEAEPGSWPPDYDRQIFGLEDPEVHA